MRAAEAPEVDQGVSFDARQDREEGGVQVGQGEGSAGCGHRDDLLGAGNRPVDCRGDSVGGDRMPRLCAEGERAAGRLPCP